MGGEEMKNYSIYYRHCPIYNQYMVCCVERCPCINEELKKYSPQPYYFYPIWWTPTTADYFPPTYFYISY